MNGGRLFQLLVFSTDVTLVPHAVSAGVDGVVIDWERRGKHRRQALCDTQINDDTPEDLRRVRAVTAAPVICRINGVCDSTPTEIEAALECGASEILVPMIRTVREAAEVLELVGGRCGVGILIETEDAVQRAAALAALPLSRVYVGLNNLAINRGNPNLFDAVTDGTVERVRRVCDRPFGFGGLTMPALGHPIPCRLLIAEMMRLECAFSFLRRSFHRNLTGRSLPGVVAAIREGLDAARQQSRSDIDRDRLALDIAARGLLDVLRR